MVLKESDSAVVKTLHRNLLLPVSAIPRTDQIEDILPSNQLNKDLNQGKLRLSQLFSFLNLNIVLIQSRRK